MICDIGYITVTRYKRLILSTGEHRRKTQCKSIRNNIECEVGHMYEGSEMINGRTMMDEINESVRMSM